MTDLVKWPDYLRPLLRDNKTVQRGETYEMSDTRYGPAYVRPFTDDAPTTVSGTLRFTRSHARRFQVWLASINYGLDPFIMPIDSEYGVEDQTVQATPDSFRNPVQNGELWSYNVTLIIREWNKGELSDYADTFFDIGWNVTADFGVFDTTLNELMPS